MLKRIRMAAGVLFSIAGYGGIFAWHVWMAWLVNNSHGAFWGIVAFSTPPVSDLIMTGAAIGSIGVLNAFVGSLAACLASMGAAQYLLRDS